MSTLAWKEINTVLLDMDGTLLDLHFDNHFWLHHVPQKLAKQNGISIQEATTFIKAEYEKVTGTLSWYCLDFWADKLNMDIVEAKREVEHLIKMRDDTIPFLDALKDSGREVILVTNAHPDSLSLKVEHTQLDEHIDLLISTHEFSVTKESQLLWQKLQAKLNFDPKHTLFVDDSLGILEAAKEFGIQHLLAVSNPDSQQPTREINHFPSVQDYRYLIDDIMTQPYRVG
ncbi:GMP/IMP nucleotidase [Paraglaciecola sp.]|uniref:GMP/IMP nucleotidase n=1 Tax=Paraglaciecola sp. TaxID=1920173 RepID=UPI003EF54E95